MAFMSDSSDDEYYFNASAYRPNEYQKRERDIERNREKVPNKIEFEEHIRNKMDLEIEDSLRVIPPEKKAPNYVKMEKLRTYKLDRERHQTDLSLVRSHLLNEYIERKINKRLEQLLSSQLHKKETTKKSSKSETLSEEELIEQKVEARFAEIEEKKRKAEEKENLRKEIEKNKTDLLEMEKRVAKMFQESLLQQKQQFEREKDLEVQINSQHDKTAYEAKSSKTESLSEEELIEQKVQARLAEIEEKKRKEEEHEKLIQEIAKRENHLIEIEKRMAKTLQESLQQQKQKFEKEIESLLGKNKQITVLEEPTNYSSIKQKSIRLEIDFGKARGEYQILLLGGTGTGKSTLINTMANYFLGGSLKHPKVVIPTKYFKNTESGCSNYHSESALDDVTKSQTTKCLTYTFTHPKNRSLKFGFIDSPGLSDTEGTKQDDAHLEEIINTAITAGALSAIIVIANGTESRVTPSIMNTLVRLGNNLPDELIDRNLLLVLTKCSRISATFDEDFFAKEIARPKEVFYMDNQAFCSDPRTWQLDEEAYEGLVLKWKQSHRTFDNLLKTITGMSVTSTNSFQNMKDLRNKLKSEIATICQDIANIQKVQDSLEAAQIAAQKSGNEKDSFSSFTKEETKSLKKIVPASYHSTVCTKHLLQDIICHQNCGLEFREGTETEHFRGYFCFRGGAQECSECGCSPESHYHAMVALETVTDTIEKVLEDMKAQYDSADADYQKFSADSDTFQSTLDNLQAEVDQKYQQIHQLCHDLSKICSRFNFVDELHANIENMKLEARIIKNADIRKNAENEIAKLFKLANDLSANQSFKGSYPSYKGSNSHSNTSNTSNMNRYSTDTSNSFGQNLSNAFKSFKKSFIF